MTMTTNKIPHEAAYLYCPDCQTESSATPGDYFQADDAHVFRCCFGQPMLLCGRRSRFEGDRVIQETVTVGDLRRLVTNVGEKVRA